MNEYYTETRIIEMVVRLTSVQLQTYIEAKFITPLQSETGWMFGPDDLARIELICDLSEDFDLEDEALGVVLSLIDQLHGVRTQLRNLTRAIEAQPEEARARLIATLEPSL